MLTNLEINRRDTLKFINFSEFNLNFETELEKIIKFIKKHRGLDDSVRFQKYFNTWEKLSDCVFVYEFCEETEKTKTNYISIIISPPGGDRFRCYVQTRYFYIFDRPANHRMTRVFSNFWKAKPPQEPFKLVG